jgi:hypothetical protein
VGIQHPVKWPAGATRANENIPTRRHRAETELEEQSIWSSFLTFSPIQLRAVWGPTLNVCEQKVEIRGAALATLPLHRLVQELPGWFSTWARKCRPFMSL